MINFNLDQIEATFGSNGKRWIESLATQLPKGWGLKQLSRKIDNPTSLQKRSFEITGSSESDRKTMETFLSKVRGGKGYAVSLGQKNEKRNWIVVLNEMRV